jgi:hypothetical protein
MTLSDRALAVQGHSDGIGLCFSVENENFKIVLVLIAKAMFFEFFLSNLTGHC